MASALFPFFRHTISNVRLAVVDTLHSFISVKSLPVDWIDAPFLRLLFQNLVVEERFDIRDRTAQTWQLALSVSGSKTEIVVSPQVILEWYAMTMTPLGTAIDASTFYRPTEPTSDGPQERHNVDKNMLAQDLGLISIETTLKARVAAATALAHLITFWPADVSLKVRFSRYLLTPYRGKQPTHCSCPFSPITSTLPACCRSSWAQLLLKNGLAITAPSILHKPHYTNVHPSPGRSA